ncbi:hypothetical protein [Myxococcus stipitatus]|uniref:hypothetical protein n=1 Tax=Myxococcus stipitatus TaxID=83455 RepID=UPI0030CC24A3
MSLLRAVVCGLSCLSASASWAQSLERFDEQLGPPLESPSQGPVTDVGLMAPESQVDRELLQRLLITELKPAPHGETLDTVDLPEVMKQRNMPLLTLRFRFTDTSAPTSTQK